jgi:hypothetical protein
MVRQRSKTAAAFRRHAWPRAKIERRNQPALASAANSAASSTSDPRAVLISQLCAGRVRRSRPIQLRFHDSPSCAG